MPDDLTSRSFPWRSRTPHAVPGGVRAVLAHLPALEEVDGGHVVGLAVGPVVGPFHRLLPVPHGRFRCHPQLRIVIALVLNVERVPRVERGQPHDLQRDGVGEPLFYRRAGFSLGVVGELAVLEGCRGHCGLAWVSATNKFRSAKPRCALVSPRAPLLANLVPPVVVACVQRAAIEHIQLLQAVDVVRDVGPVVVFARDLFHDLVQQVPLVLLVLAVGTDPEASPSADLVFL